MFGESKHRTQQTVMGACIASLAMFHWFSVFTDLHVMREAWQRVSPGTPAGSGHSHGGGLAVSAGSYLHG